jgi:hypothetical protein
MSVLQEEVRLSREIQEKGKLDMQDLLRIRKMFLRLDILVSLVEGMLD